MNFEHAQFLLDRISEIKPGETTPEDIMLIYEITRFSTKGSEFLQRSCTILLNIISRVQEISIVLEDIIVDKFCEMTCSSDFREQRLPILTLMINNIDEVSVKKGENVMYIFYIFIFYR